MWEKRILSALEWVAWHGRGTTALAAVGTMLLVIEVFARLQSAAQNIRGRNLA